MNIYLYDNNKREYIDFPVIPKEISIISPQKVEDFETLGQGNLKIIGEMGTKSLTLESFFPVKNYNFLKSKKWMGMTYIDRLQIWRNNKSPLFLLIDDLKINFPCVISNLEYSIQDGSGDIYFKLDIEEYKIPQIKKTTLNKNIVTVKSQKQATAAQPAKTVNYLKNSYGVVIARNGLNVRNGNGIGYSKIGSLRYGQRIKLYRLESNGRWWHIYFGNHGGHVSAQYIRRI